ncbi:DNA polymerase III subunit gamma and tau [Changpingibacter yushuensis]|uniref:DNA polymerase III subunit gamma and tau n=1 Tax=Changpingibacter yushuensis TaxID=2758440 RepID=UPI0021CD1ACA|nr:DNA polymerase III subunit gamma and tau [Changpingibacter yushuensis]
MALYRRYRPQKFQDVIGQEQVTRPLMAALRADKTAHAYLFSGPRGCGKTTSARILARCLNCEQAPTDTPCGECASCRELSLSGSGSLDVVEMDAASHGGVDDARDLIERASFAPARDRYKIFIIDEAHMVSNQGFNALLKLVEEPPAHVKFIFATTEPEKVIGTIRSRTHHYPFRLVPPETLNGYLEQIAAEEGIHVGTGVIPLVVRSGGGSVRDSLSVLDQLIGGAEDGELTYDAAIGLLGYTDGSLLDDAVEAIGSGSGATLFSVVDRVIQSGHDPRRFVEDLLQRLRDIIVIALAGEQASDVLTSVPQDQYARMLDQAEHLGAARASKSADLVNEALSLMVGATSPRLQLELLCARLLLPTQAPAPSEEGAPHEPSATAPVRERPASAIPRPKSAIRQPAAGSVAQPVRPSGRVVSPGWAAPQEDRSASASAADARQAPIRSTFTPAESPAPTPSATVQAPSAVSTVLPQTEPSGPVLADTEQASSAQARHGQTPDRVDSAAPSVEIDEARWGEVLAAVHNRSNVAWSKLQYVEAHTVENGVLTVVFSMPGMAARFANGRDPAVLLEAVKDVLAVDVEVRAVEEGEQSSPKVAAASKAAEARFPADTQIPPSSSRSEHDSGARGHTEPATVPGATHQPENWSEGQAEYETASQAGHGPENQAEGQAEYETASQAGHGPESQTEKWSEGQAEYEPEGQPALSAAELAREFTTYGSVPEAHEPERPASGRFEVPSVSDGAESANSSAGDDPAGVLALLLSDSFDIPPARATSPDRRVPDQPERATSPDQRVPDRRVPDRRLSDQRVPDQREDATSQDLEPYPSQVPPPYPESDPYSEAVPSVDSAPDASWAPADTTDVPFYQRQMPMLKPPVPMNRPDHSAKRGSIASRILAAHAPGASLPPTSLHAAGSGLTTPIRDEDEVSADDPTIEQSNLVGIDVVLDTFGGTIIEEVANENGGS